MDSVLHTLYRTYFLLNGLCVSGEDVQFMDKKHEVVLMVRAKEIKLIKLNETLIDTTEKSKIAKRSLCRDLDGNGWIYENEKSIYGYELYFKKIEDDTYEIRVSNQKICVEDRDK